MKRMILMITAVLTVTCLAACTTAAPLTFDDISEATSKENIETSSTIAQAAVESTRLTDDYNDALTVQDQLALGTIQLEETEWAVDETLAAALLPLWQAVQSLSNSATTAEAEVNAVVNQIQDTMSPAQIQTISAMALTTESMNNLLESGALGFGGRGGRSGNADGDTPAGSFPGGFGGGIPGQGGLGQGGPGGFADLSEDDIVTRRAEFAGGNGSEGMQNQFAVTAVVRFLEQKTGVQSANPQRGLFSTVIEVVSAATGLAVEEVQAHTQEGKPFAEIVTEHGADLDAVRAALIEAIKALPNAEELDAEQLADLWLGISE
jgi:predicted small lipoprotein YifL